jgi:FkbM family methyltransferase
MDRQIWGGVFFDVGANIGLYSLYYAKKFISSKVFSFECATKNLKLLSSNVSINKVSDRVLIVTNTLSDKTCFGQIYKDDLSEGASSTAFESKIQFSEGMGLNGFLTLGFSLDYLFENLLLKDFPTLLKVDVDGIENKILLGSRSILANRTLKSIYVEVDYANHINKKTIHLLLQENGFKLKSINQASMFKLTRYNSLYNEIWVRAE